MTMGVYIIKNTVTGKVYVGSSVAVEKRWKVHQSVLRRNKHHSPKLQNSWNIYGESSFIFGIVEEVGEVELLLQTEQWYLDNWNTVENGYNVAPVAGRPIGPQKGIPRSDDVKAKISATKKANPCPGSRKGVILSEETKAKISASKMGKIGHSIGIPRSEETKAKIRAALLNCHHPQRRKKIKATREDGLIIFFDSISAAALAGFNHISRSIKNGIRNKGFSFEYKE